MTKTEEYQQEIVEFLKLNDFNMAERLKSVPAVKHSWIFRLNLAKKEKDKLLKAKKKIKDALIENRIATGVVNLSKTTLDGIENDAKLEDINERISELEFLIEYLNNVVNMILWIHQDIKNILDHKRIEME
jgi:hypothetical protein